MLTIPESIEIWGGAECSVTRIGGKFRDQLQMSGHDQRIGDMELIKSLGVKKLRCPLLWERSCSFHERTCNWDWNDRYLNEARQNGIEPIVGLVHHGSGPSWTSLLDPHFPEHLADYAYQVAKRYPWIRYYTPINEPLTTARFSCLYGHWYPHDKSDNSFCKALINQCRAVKLCMKAITSVNPNAKLIQTEDLGVVYSTAELAEQADFENRRRWLSLDILSGRFSDQHPLVSYLQYSGIDEASILALCDWELPLEVIGFNYYVTSARFLDHKTRSYPPGLVGSNGREEYVDVEAVRVGYDPISILKDLLKEAWSRYSIPISLTEIHLTCEPEEQMRWFLDCYLAAESLKLKGVNIQAVTAWALFGLYDWDTLTVESRMKYEKGIIDISDGKLEFSLLGKVLKKLASGKILGSLATKENGWWAKPERIHYPIAPGLPTASAA